MKKVDKLPILKELNKDLIHHLTLEILKTYDFSNEPDILKVADTYSNKYIEVYNYLLKKYYVEKTPEEKEQSGYRRHRGNSGIF